MEEKGERERGSKREIDESRFLITLSTELLHSFCNIFIHVLKCPTGSNHFLLLRFFMLYPHINTTKVEEFYQRTKKRKLFSVVYFQAYIENDALTLMADR
jgi:hypothetical protein